MIGNDIVDIDLSRKESNWQRKGFLNKLFTKNEQDQINSSKNPEVIVWQLWSRKEAVYKIILQKGGTHGFYPIKIECNDFEVVHFQNQKYYTKTIKTKQYIYSVAVSDINDFKKIKHLKNTNAIFKINEIPFIKLNNLNVNISKTHHGRFEKVVFLNN